MKCKVCGKRSNTIGAMARHYRKKHPGRMKRRKSLQTPSSAPGTRKSRRVTRSVRDSELPSGFFPDGSTVTVTWVV